MVFSGQPSSACHACRHRRLRCDKLPSGCGQCARKHMACPGYRNGSELRIRNETRRITEKALGFRRTSSIRKPTPKPTPKPKPKPIATISTSPTCAFPLPQADEERHGIVPRTLKQPAEEISVAYFMSTYITSSSFETYLPQLYTQVTLVQDGLSSAINAVAFAAFALEARDDGLMVLSHKQYSVALSRINDALSKPETAVLDRTLAGVLLLGLFESIIFQTKTSLENWTAHTQGTVGLLKMRGLQRSQSITARRMFLQASSNIRTSCMQRGVPIPTELVELTDEYTKLFDPSGATLVLSSLMDKAAVIKTRIATDGCRCLIDEALELDHELAALSNREDDVTEHDHLTLLIMPVRHPRRTMARYWNAIHMIRMFLNEVIWEGAAQALREVQTGIMMPPSLQSDQHHFLRLQDHTVDNMAQIANSVFTLVPEFIDLAATPTPRFSPAARGLFWPLGILQRCPACPPFAHKRALVILDQLGEDLNLRGALNVAKLIVDGSGVLEDRQVNPLRIMWCDLTW